MDVLIIMNVMSVIQAVRHVTVTVKRRTNVHPAFVGPICRSQDLPKAHVSATCNSMVTPLHVIASVLT